MKIMRKRTILWTVLGVFGFAAVALAAVVMGITQSPRGIATPRVYDYATGAPGSYYLDIPTLSANDTFVGLTLTQTLTNKTLTSPTITGGAWTGGTDLAVADGGTGASTGSAALTNLGVTTFAKTVLDDTTQGAVQTTIGLGTGDSPTFTSLTLTSGADTVDITATGTVIMGDDAGDSVTIKGVTLTTVGTDLWDDASVDAQLTTLGFSTFVKTILNDAAAGNVCTTIGLGTGDTPTFAGLAITGETRLNGAVDLGNAAGDAIGYSGTVTTDIVFEGTTDDTAEATLDPGDPKVDSTVTFNQDESGRTVLAIGRTYSETTVYNTTKDGYTQTVADLTFKAGDVMKFEFAGNKSAGNAAGQVLLDIDGATIVTLETAAATTGDFVGSFTIYNTTAATQKCSGSLNTAVATDHKADYGTDTTNFADGGSTNIKVRIVSGHGSDLMTLYYVKAVKE